MAAVVVVVGVAAPGVDVVGVAMVAVVVVVGPAVLVGGTFAGGVMLAFAGGVAVVSERRDEMKRLVENVEGEGLEGLIGEQVALWCANYIYAGRLIGVNATDVLLADAKVVYETGELCAPQWKDAQALPGPWYVRTASIESYGKVQR